MDERLIKAICQKMEQYGMPEFRDFYPAMDILQLVKDAGYSKRELVPINFQELNQFVMDFRKHSSFHGDEGLVQAICDRFGYE